MREAPNDIHIVDFTYITEEPHIIILSLYSTVIGREKKKHYTIKKI